MDRIPGAGGASRSRLDASCKADILIYDGYGILRYRRAPCCRSSVLVLGAVRRRALRGRSASEAARREPGLYTILTFSSD